MLITCDDLETHSLCEKRANRIRDIHSHTTRRGAYPSSTSRTCIHEGDPHSAASAASWGSQLCDTTADYASPLPRGRSSDAHISKKYEARPTH